MDQKTNLSLAAQKFEKQYQKRFGVIAGYLPRDLEHIGNWLSRQVELAQKKKEEQGSEFSLLPSVNAMATLLKNNPALSAQVTQMIIEGLVIHQEYEPNEKYYIKNIMDLLITMNFMIIQAPVFEPKVSHTAFPMSGLFVYMMATAAGWNVFRNDLFNNSLRNILKAWCSYLDSAYSLDVVTTKPNGWLSPQSVINNSLDQFVTEADKQKDPIHWGFESFNGYFHREIIPICRPLDGPGNDAVIVSANDGTVYRIARNVKRETNFEIKSQPYSLVNMLDNTYVDNFVGGDVLQTFLSGHDYHRWRAPISGTILSARVVPGYMFSELLEEGWDPTAGTYSQGYEANVNTRGLIFIQHDDPKIGKVCVIPVGITEISSIEIEPKIIPGYRVEKGDELGSFSYGGSTLCLVFQPGAIKQFTVVNPDPDNDSDNGPFIRVKAQVAIANTSFKN